MEQYIGLDVSLKETAISIRQDGKKFWRGKCASDPQLLAALISKRAPYARQNRVRNGAAIGMVLPFANGRGPAGDLHRCAACQGRAGYGREQD